MENFVALWIALSIFNPTIWYYNVRKSSIFSIYNNDQIDRQINKSINWILKAQKITKSGGVSARYIPSLFLGKWDGPYPETTGYIIRTFVEYMQSEEKLKEKLYEPTLNMGNWLLSLQNHEGWFPGGVIRDNKHKAFPTVFNNGQIILGLNSLYKYTKNENYMKAALRCAKWLISVQEEDGSWVKYAYHNKARTYHSRVAWAIAEVGNLTGDQLLLRASQKFISWLVKNVKPNNLWPTKADFIDDNVSVLHTLAYTIRGFMETSHILELENCEKMSINMAAKLMKSFEIRRSLKGVLYNWKPVCNYLCITGIFQTSIIFFRAYELSRDIRFANSGLKLLDLGKRYQVQSGPNMGGFPGSFPTWGKYMPFSFPNWAVKFFLDAALQAHKIKTEIGKEILK